MVAGQQGPCTWVLMKDAVPPADHARLIAAMREVGRANTPVCLLVVLHNCPRPSADERRDFADMVKGLQRPQNIRGLALVTDAAMVRGALTAINWLVRTTVKQSVFSAPPPALRWLESLGIGVDAAAVENAMALADPMYRRLRWA